MSKVFVRDGDIVKRGTPSLMWKPRVWPVAAKPWKLPSVFMTCRRAPSKAFSEVVGIHRALSPCRLSRRWKILLNAQLTTARQQSQQFRSQLEQLATRITSRSKTLQLKEQIASDFKPLYEVGAMARIQYLTQLNQVQETRAEVATLEEERSRLVGAVAAQLNQIDRRMIQIRAELVGLKETISYRTVRAPVSGKVFDTKVSPQTVVSGDQTVLKLVPANRLQAKVEISDVDIGFVKVGLPVNVSVDSFPSGEFGYIKGTLTKLGSDVWRLISAHPNIASQPLCRSRSNPLSLVTSNSIFRVAWAFQPISSCAHAL